MGRGPVQAAAGTVVAHRRARVGVRGGFLDVAERHPGVEGGGDERMPQRVRPDRLGDCGTDGYPADDPGGTVPAQPPDRDRAGGVAAGRRELTNGAVAGRLYIWPHTVNTPSAARVR